MDESLSSSFLWLFCATQYWMKHIFRLMHGYIRFLFKEIYISVIMIALTMSFFEFLPFYVTDGDQDRNKYIEL